MSQTSEKDHPQKDFLWLHLRELPYFRALLRAVEARFYDDIDLPSPILDLGCGDGHFASLTFDNPIDIGVDPLWEPLNEAARRTTYQDLTQSEGALLPFPDGHFHSCISNSVLEHIINVDPVLREVSRVLKTGSTFVFSVPNHRFLSTLSIGLFLDRIGLRFLGNSYRSFFNRISRHHHCDSHDTWEARLTNNGFSIKQWFHYFSPSAFHTLEWGHYFGLPSLIIKKLSGHWIISPTSWNLFLTRKFIQRYYDEPLDQEKGVYTLFITVRQ